MVTRITRSHLTSRLSKCPLLTIKGERDENVLPFRYWVLLLKVK
ncbi:unnamed protein product [Acanthoscelides obtectus]|uniref:Uncharacterized protein n=1 Tax=Acanthoscelides obtectus TaxID=200917 RepID=A0A9P0JJ68_ACAOB|nr:unnamed protein product [Acanthoscelides obtectus]CAK1639935.1 hypothetical protein AOBTE_LOCUS11462 [Acanthoscelides obtectus]